MATRGAVFLFQEGLPDWLRLEPEGLRVIGTDLRLYGSVVLWLTAIAGRFGHLIWGSAGNPSCGLWKRVSD